MKKLMLIMMTGICFTMLCCNPAFAAKTEQRYITVESLNVRSAASTKSQILFVVHKGDKVTCYGEHLGWTKIKKGNKTGYIASQFLSKKKIKKQTTSTKKDKKTMKYVLSKNLNVRSSPSTKSQILFVAHEGNKVACYGSSSGWTKIKKGNKTGYVASQFLSKKKPKKQEASTGSVEDEIEMTVKYVISNSLNIRSASSTTSKIVSVLKKGDSVDSYGTKNGWDSIDYKGKKCFVSSKHLSDTFVSSNVSDSSYSNTEKTTKGEDVATYAKQFIGLKYVWGGTSLITGADCSGFTQAIYKHFGYNINRTAVEQRKNGRRVTTPQVGDLICYEWKKFGNTGYYHVGIYIGNDQVIHSGSSKTGVSISKWNFRAVYSIQRILN